MKKILLMSGLAAISLPTLAATNQSPMTQADNIAAQYFILDNHSNFKHWSVSTGVYTRNDKIPTKVGDLDVGYIASLEYKFNPNLYASVKTTFAGNAPMTWSGTIGLTGSSGVLRPYAEAGLEQYKDANDNLIRKVDYDAGLSVNAFSWAAPYVEVDNFLSKDSEAVAGGVVVPLPWNLSAKVEYSKNIQTKSDSAQVRVYYSF